MHTYKTNIIYCNVYYPQNVFITYISNKVKIMAANLNPYSETFRRYCHVESSEKKSTDSAHVTCL